jgi:pseudouridine-5'-phosphate glycosidase
MLETLSVPVLGYRTDTFPAFYLESSGLPVPARVDTPSAIASFVSAHWSLGGAGVIIAQPIAPEVALTPKEWEVALVQAEGLAAQSNVRGKDVTPFLLARLVELTEGRSLRANRALIVENARLAARIALEAV